MDSLSNESCLNVSPRSCLNLTRGEYDVMLYSMAGLFVASFLFCLVAIVMVFVIGGTRLLKWLPSPQEQTLQLVLFILLGAFLYNISELLKILPSSMDTCGNIVAINKQFCQVSGFLLEYFALVTYFLSFFTTFYLLRFVSARCLAKQYPLPWIILLASLLLPLVVAWIPFIGNHYRMSGAFCWIDANGPSCEIDVGGLSEEIALYYIIVFSLSISMFVMAVIILCCLCCNCFHQRNVNTEQTNSRKMAILEFVPLLIYPIVFTLFFCIDIVQRIQFAVSRETIFQLWLAHGVAGNSTCMLVPMAFIFHPLNLRRVYQRCCKGEKERRATAASETLYIFSGSMSGEERMVISDQVRGIWGYSTFHSNKKQPKKESLNSRQ